MVPSAGPPLEEANVTKRAWIRIGNKIHCYMSWSGSCSKAHFVTSEMQSEELQEATEEINRVLDELKGRHPGLAILNVGQSLLLMDVEHGDEAAPQRSYVTAESEEDAIREALSIRLDPQA